MASDPDTADDDSQWRFSLSDLEDDSEGDGGGNVAGSMAIDEELEAGDISTENALFVVVGVLLAVAFLAGFLALFP